MWKTTKAKATHGASQPRTALIGSVGQGRQAPYRAEGENGLNVAKKPRKWAGRRGKAHRY